MKPIGGEFEIDPVLLAAPERNRTFEGQLLSSGRAALLSILVHLKKQRLVEMILLPDYLCESILHTVKRAGVSYDFYPLNKDLQITTDPLYDLIKNTGALKTCVLLINYFGLIEAKKDVEWLKGIDDELIVILDNAQAFFEMEKPTLADFVFTSFRKTLPVPDGGWLRVNQKVDIEFESDREACFPFYKTIGSLIKQASNFQDIPDSAYLDFFARGEQLLDEDSGIEPISDISKIILSNLNLEAVREKRRMNAEYLSDGLRGIGLASCLKLDSHFIPLCLPLLIEQRDTIRRKLFDKKIFLPVHWPLPAKDTGKLNCGRFMAEHELSLVMDQRYSSNDMDRIVEALAELKPIPLDASSLIL